MRRVVAFNNVSVDGYFADAGGALGWVNHEDTDAEFTAFVAGNAAGGGMLLFGRITYDLMAAYWPTARAQQENPVVAQGMNSRPKVVFSRTLHSAPWANTRLVGDDPAAEVRRLKREGEHDMAILGSGTLVAQLTDERLIDEYQLVVNPVVLGKGRSMFAGVTRLVRLRRIESRPFANGNVLLRYTPVT